MVAETEFPPQSNGSYHGTPQYKCNNVLTETIFPIGFDNIVKEQVF